MELVNIYLLSIPIIVMCIIYFFHIAIKVQRKEFVRISKLKAIFLVHVIFVISPFAILISYFKIMYEIIFNNIHKDLEYSINKDYFNESK
jgi:hypothetical protein